MAYAFDNNSSQYLSTASTPIASGANPVTLAILAKTPQESSNLKVFISLSKTSSAAPLSITTVLTSMYVRLSDNLQSVDKSSAHPDNIWFSVAGNNGVKSTAAIYVDGSKGDAASDNIEGTWGFIEIGSRIATYRERFMNGNLAEAAIWSAALTDAEIASLAKGFKPTRIRPQSLVFYAPLLRNLQDLKAGLALTNNNGATVADHPRVY